MSMQIKNEHRFFENGARFVYSSFSFFVFLRLAFAIL